MFLTAVVQYTKRHIVTAIKTIAPVDGILVRNA